MSVHWKTPTERGALTFWRQRRERPVRHGKKLAERGTLTNWRQEREILVRARKGTYQAKRTYSLETAE